MSAMLLMLLVTLVRLSLVKFNVHQWSWRWCNPSLRCHESAADKPDLTRLESHKNAQKPRTWVHNR